MDGEVEVEFMYDTNYSLSDRPFRPCSHLDEKKKNTGKVSWGRLNPFQSKEGEEKIVKLFFNRERNDIPLRIHQRWCLCSRGKSVEKHGSASSAVHLVLVAIHQTSAIAFFFFFFLSPSPRPHRNPWSLVVGGQLSSLSSSEIRRVFPRRFFKRRERGVPSLSWDRGCWDIFEIVLYYNLSINIWRNQLVLNSFYR